MSDVGRQKRNIIVRVFLCGSVAKRIFLKNYAVKRLKIMCPFLLDHNIRAWR